MTRALVVAVDYTMARHSVLIDWGWREVCHNEFETPAGERVGYLPNRWFRYRERETIARGTRLYCGHEWWLRDDHDLLLQMISEGRLVRVDPSEGNALAGAGCAS